MDPLGYLALACGQEGYYKSVTPVSDPPYGCGVRNRELLVMREDALAEYSQMLNDDEEMKDYLPLGEKGSAIILIRNVKTNKDIPNALLRSRNKNSNAEIRYLNEAQDDWALDKTASTGACVVANPLDAEKLDAFLGDEKINDMEATLGVTSNVIFLFYIGREKL